MKLTYAFVRLAPGKFRLRIAQMRSREEAQTLAHELAEKIDIHSPAVSR